METKYSASGLPLRSPDHEGMWCSLCECWPGVHTPSVVSHVYNSSTWEMTFKVATGYVVSQTGSYEPLSSGGGGRGRGEEIANSEFSNRVDTHRGESPFTNLNTCMTRPPQNDQLSLQDFVHLLYILQILKWDQLIWLCQIKGGNLNVFFIKRDIRISSWNNWHPMASQQQHIHIYKAPGQSFSEKCQDYKAINSNLWLW